MSAGTFVGACDKLELENRVLRKLDQNMTVPHLLAHLRHFSSSSGAHLGRNHKVGPQYIFKQLPLRRYLPLTIQPPLFRMKVRGVGPDADCEDRFMSA